ncbi:MAG: hypothetical protein Kow0089_06370 [Desulfobulbaceae bacterium]
MKDLPEKEQAELELRALAREAADCRLIAAHFESIFNALPDALVFTDAERRIVMANPAVEKVFGYRPEEVIGRKTEMFYASREEYERQGRIRFNLSAEEQVKPYKVEYRRRDGSVFLSETVGTVVRDGEGTVLGYLGLMRDISERKARKEQLRRAELYYRTVANFTYDWEYWVDPAGIFLYVSPSCERITGYRPEEFLADDGLLRRIVYPEDLEVWDRHVEESEKDLRLRELQFRIVRRDGEVRWMEHACRPVVDEESGFLGYRASNRDITRRKLVEDELRSALGELRVLKERVEAESRYLREEIRLEHDFENIIGNSNALQYVLFKVQQVAGTDTSVLILGETGSGKELIARAIHNTGSRSERPLVKVNCAALPAELIETELFGHERGAFTNAHNRRLGRFEVADGATLFLDEIGELPLALQAKLLRVLQDGEFERLGSSKTVKVDVRIIAATNRDLEEDVKAGRFRRDLWYRLNVFPITVPPLRDRVEDIPLLTNYFVNTLARRLGREIRVIPAATMERLKRYSWPGNVRELENVIERAVITSTDGVLRLADKLSDAGNHGENGLKPLREVEREYILRVLEQVGWKVSGRNSAAEILQLDRSTLRARMKKLGIERPR